MNIYLENSAMNIYLEKKNNIETNALNYAWIHTVKTVVKKFKQPCIPGAWLKLLENLNNVKNRTQIS